MILGKVVGNVVSTIKCPDYDGYKLLVVQPVDHAGVPNGKSLLAVDAVQAALGIRCWSLMKAALAGPFWTLLKNARSALSSLALWMKFLAKVTKVS